LETRRPDRVEEPTLCFTRAIIEDVVSYENDSVVISVVIAGRKVHRVLIDQGSLANVMFWKTFINFQLSPDQLRPYDGCLVGFPGDQVEVQGYVALRTTFLDENTTRIITIRYIVVNMPFAYNLLLGRPSLNRLGAVASTTHMRMRLPSEEGGVIIVKAN